MPSDKPLLSRIEEEALLALPLKIELEEGGFEVLLVPDGSKAITELELDASRFSGLITDIRLGSGVQIQARLSAK